MPPTDRTDTAEPVWSWAELSRVLTGQPAPGPDISGVKVDSRLIRPGELFIALPGDPGSRFNPSYRSAVDGHDFVAAAAAQGAVGAVVHRAVETAVPLAIIQVSDTYDALWALGSAARSRARCPVVGITGSSGKTTAKRFISAALHGFAPPGSFNNHIGVPLSLANMPLDSTAGVFEIGTNHPGEILPLAQMVHADVALLLNVHNAHIENFTSWEALREEKVSIFNALDDKSMAISEDLLGLDFGCSFGFSDRADARVVALQGQQATINLFGEEYAAKVPGGGAHRASTVAATLLVCKLLGVDLGEACNLPDDCIPEGRGNLLHCGAATVVDESYNANPQSMRAALRSFLNLEGHSSRIVVLGEMLELGDEAAAAHLALAEVLSEFDEVVLVGAGMRALASALNAPWSAEADEALLASVVARAQNGGQNPALMVKGSNRVFWARGFVQQLAQLLNQHYVSRVTN